MDESITEHCSSETLMLRVAQGDQRAFAAIMARHQDRVMAVAFRFLGNRQEAEDLAQEVFLRVWRSAPSYAPSARFTTWLYAITANRCKSALRSFWRTGVLLLGAFSTEEEDRADLSSHCRSPSPEDLALGAERARQVPAQDPTPGHHLAPLRGPDLRRDRRGPGRKRPCRGVPSGPGQAQPGRKVAPTSKMTAGFPFPLGFTVQQPGSAAVW